MQLSLSSRAKRATNQSDCKRSRCDGRCVHAYIYVDVKFIYVCRRVRSHIYVGVYIHISMSTCTLYLCRRVHSYIYVGVYIHISMSTCSFIYLCRRVHLGLNSRKKSYESAIALGATGAVVCCYLGSFAPQGKAAGFLGNAQTVCCSVLQCFAVCCSVSQ